MCLNKSSISAVLPSKLAYCFSTSLYNSRHCECCIFSNHTASSFPGGKKKGYSCFSLGRSFGAVSKKAFSKRSTLIVAGISSTAFSILLFLSHEASMKKLKINDKTNVGFILCTYFSPDGSGILFLSTPKVLESLLELTKKDKAHSRK